MDNQEKRNVTVTFRCKKSEKELLKSKAKYARLSLTDYILRCSSKKKIIVIDGLPELVKEINKIGVNINQIVRVANQFKSVDENSVRRIANEQIKIQNAIYDFMKQIAQTDK